MKDDETTKTEKVLRDFGRSMFLAGVEHGRGNPVHRTRIGDAFVGVGLALYVRVTLQEAGTFGAIGRAVWSLLGVVYTLFVIASCRNSWSARRR